MAKKKKNYPVRDKKQKGINIPEDIFAGVEKICNKFGMSKTDFVGLCVNEIEERLLRNEEEKIWQVYKEYRLKKCQEKLRNIESETFAPFETAEEQTADPELSEESPEELAKDYETKLKELEAKVLKNELIDEPAQLQLIHYGKCPHCLGELSESASKFDGSILRCNSCNYYAPLKANVPYIAGKFKDGIRYDDPV